jgi:hypothetical protein
MKKIIGYTIAIIGLAGLLASLSPETLAQIPQLSKIPSLTLTIASVIIVAIGIFLVYSSNKSGTKKERELPIYKGKDVVGYRRH